MKKCSECKKNIIPFFQHYIDNPFIKKDEKIHYGCFLILLGKKIISGEVRIVKSNEKEK